MNQYIGYVSQDSADTTAERKHFDQKSDSEIFFIGSVKLDNGITASVNVQLEADANGGASDTFDESYLRLDTDLGQVRLGYTDPASLSVSVEAPYVGINPTNGDQAFWIANPTDNVAGVGGSTIGGGDENRVYYVTPKIAGFTGAASYAASTTDAQTQPLVNEPAQTDLGLQWAGAVGDFALRASAGYWWNEGSTSTDSGSNRNLRFGGDVTFADFTVGAGWLRRSAKSGATAGSDATSWNVGVAYKPGPFAVSLTYYSAEAEGSRTVAGDDTSRRYVFGGTYSIGPGVELMTNVLYHNIQDEANARSAENKGVAVIGGIQLAF